MEKTEYIEPEGLHVTIDRVVYHSQKKGSPDRPHCFVYFVTIRNDSEIAVTIKGRKWVVTNDRGEITAVEGEGVVGQFPTLQPGEEFDYNSFHMINTVTATAEGSYLGVDPDGRKVLVRIPRFQLVVPPDEKSGAVEI